MNRSDMAFSQGHGGNPLSGLTKRDYFAAAALPQVMAIMIKAKWPIEDHDRLFALMAYRIADAMLAARDAK